MAQVTSSGARRFAGRVEIGGGVSIIRALLAGLAGTAVFTMLLYAAPLMGFPPMPLLTIVNGEESYEYGSRPHCSGFAQSNR